MQTDDLVSCVKSDLLKSCGTFRVLVGVTGSVAALKLPLLVTQLLQLPGVSCFLLFIFLFRVFTQLKSYFCLSLSSIVQVYILPCSWSHCHYCTTPVKAHVYRKMEMLQLLCNDIKSTAATKLHSSKILLLSFY